MSSTQQVASLDAINIFKLPRHGVADPKAGRILDCHPGKDHPGKFNDPKKHKEQDWKGDHKFYDRLPSTSSFEMRKLPLLHGFSHSFVK
jgi:hypothetical protein